jgi:Cytosolic carboxypeptidase N-terminal domain/Zinc carboxypeptidase
MRASVTEVGLFELENQIFYDVCLLSTLFRMIISQISPLVSFVFFFYGDATTQREPISQHMQYFSFRSTIAKGGDHDGGGAVRVRYVLANAADVSYPEAWAGTTVCYATMKDNDNCADGADDDDDERRLPDVDSWKRIKDTFYTQGQLNWEYLHHSNSSSNSGVEGKEVETVWFAYFPPFSYGRHQALIAKCRQKASTMRGCCVVESLGTSLEGRNVDCITVGTGPLQAWIIHRQHPGETMAEHYAEGLLKRLLGLGGGSSKDADEAAVEEYVEEKVWKTFTFHIVPCMCPDGGVRGHLRTNGYVFCVCPSLL